MGYSFSIKNANAVGHLIEGNVYTFLHQTLSFEEQFQPNIEFLDRLITRTEDDFYTSEIFWKNISPDLNNLREEWKFLKNEIKPYRDLSRIYKSYFLRQNRRLLQFLERISKILSRCKIKSLLLPGFSRDKINDLLVDRSILRDIVRIHPGDTALILQLKERLNENETSILNVFSKFNKAFQRIDQWPGVLLWNDNDSLFLPISSDYELFEIYNILRYERNSFSYLRNHFGKDEQHGKYAYLFHLSDLHFGNKIAEKRKMRIVKILENNLNDLEDTATAIPIITGDLMDSPNSSNKQAYSEFSELLIAKGFEKPIHILGNHDVDTSGFLKLLTKQKAVISSLSNNSKIEILESLKLALIKFDSNTGGELAQGKIGDDQMMEIGSAIDSLKDKELYTFIALLHHHPKEIENPEWYSRDWYEAFLGTKGFEKTMKLVDADIFFQWLEKRNIKYVLHGHKHIPKIQNHNDITIIAAGSSTGSVKHKESGKTFLSYNLIKYNLDNSKPVSCSIIAEEIIGAGTKNLILHRM